MKCALCMLAAHILDKKSFSVLNLTQFAVNYPPQTSVTHVCVSHRGVFELDKADELGSSAQTECEVLVVPLHLDIRWQLFATDIVWR